MDSWKTTGASLGAMLRSLLTPCPADSKAPFAGGGFSLRQQRDSRARAKPADKIAVGVDGTLWQKGDAVPQ
jgi:hypothetical protein